MWEKLDKVGLVIFKTRHLVDILCAQVLANEMKFLMNDLNKQCHYGEAIVDMKRILSKACSNVFNIYFCSAERKSYDDPEHNKYCDEFDK